MKLAQDVMGVLARNPGEPHTMQEITKPIRRSGGNAKAIRTQCLRVLEALRELEQVDVHQEPGKKPRYSMRKTPRKAA